MVTTIRNASGGAFLSGSVQNISVKQSSKISIINIPGANKNVIQRFGTSNREFQVDGFITISGGTTFISGLNGGTGSLTFSNPIETAISTVTVLFYNVQFKDSGNRPMERKFSFEAVEIL